VLPHQPDQGQLLRAVLAAYGHVVDLRKCAQLCLLATKA
jgi:hypothetical protein